MPEELGMQPHFFGEGANFGQTWEKFSKVCPKFVKFGQTLDKFG